MTIDELARRLNAYEKVDRTAFRRRARVLQSIWREEQGFPCGEFRGRKMGSRLEMPWAKKALANYLTDTIKAVVRAEVEDPARSAGKMYGKPRIYNDLLSSQPLCFNLFAELRSDLPLLSAVVREMTGGRLTEVCRIEFEYSPGRGDSRYLEDRSAFDVFLECVTPAGGKGFVGIEVKYHEDLRGGAGRHRARYDEVAEGMGCFAAGASERLHRSPLQQIWRDHLLAGITKKVDGYSDGLFVMLYPEQNEDVARAVRAYAECLSDTAGFAAWTLEDFAARLRERSSADWIGRFRDRYLAFEKIDSRMAQMLGGRSS